MQTPSARTLHTILTDQIERLSCHGWHVVYRSHRDAILSRRWRRWRRLSVQVWPDGRVTLTGPVSWPLSVPGDWLCPRCAYLNLWHREGCVRCGCWKELA